MFRVEILIINSLFCDVIPSVLYCCRLGG